MVRESEEVGVGHARPSPSDEGQYKAGQLRQRSRSAQGSSATRLPLVVGALQTFLDRDDRLPPSVRLARASLDSLKVESDEQLLARLLANGQALSLSLSAS